MAPLYYTLGVVIFVVAILGSIALHECGHMVPAKRFGARVPQFFVGFGKTIWSKKVGETEYGVKQIPLGGFVKIIGMLPPDPKSGKLRETNTGLFTQLIADARAAEGQLIQKGDEDRLFYKLSWWKKVIVMSGGPTVNVLIAFFLFWAIFATMGNPGDVRREPVVDEVQGCIVPLDETDRACTEQELRDNPTPAYAAELQEGDRFVSFNGEPIEDWTQLQGLIRGNGEKKAVLGIERDGKLIQETVTTAVTPRPTDPNDPEKLESVGFLGVVPESHLPTGGPIYTLQQMGGYTVETVQAIGALPVKVWHVGRALVGLEERDRESPVSIVGGGRFAGEISAEDAFPVKEKFQLLLLLIAGFNLFVGLFNFVPLLPLDGGHIAGALWEAVRRGWARIFRRPDPGYVDVAKLLPVAYVMAAAFIVMSVVLIVADIFIPLHLTS